MGKYIYFAVGFIVLSLLLSVKTLYSAVDELKQEKTTLELSLKDAESKNNKLNHTISLQAETQQSIDDTQQAIREMHEQIADELQRTKYTIKNQIKGLPCYEQTIPADAIDAICIMQPSNKACHTNNDKDKGDNSSGINATKTKAD